METPEEDVKPTIHSDDVVKIQSDIKPKHSRYEDVWPADVHAAFMEAIALYPPMGKRRLKYYRVSTGMDENESSPAIKSFGRCQLIQAYVMEKTGKNRSRKQVSSHLQRLKKIYKDNPAMRALFSENSQALSDNHSQDILANLSPSSASSPKSEFDHWHPAAIDNLQNTVTSLDRPSAFSHNAELPSSVSGASKMLGPSTNFHGRPSFVLSQENFSRQGCQAGVLHCSNGAPLFQYHEPSPFQDAIGGAFQASPNFTASTFSVSTRRLVSKRPVIGRQLDLPPSYQSRTIYPHGFQSAHRINSHDGLNYPSPDIPCSFLVSPNEQIHYTPLHPVQAFHPDRRLLGQDLECDWAWPQDSNVSFSPFVAPLSRRSAFSEIRLQYPLSMYQFAPLCPERMFGSPESYTSSSESDGSILSKGLSYSILPSPTSLSETMSTRAPISFPEQDGVPGSSEYLASPLITKPTPLYPLSYVHSNDRLLSQHQTTAFHDYLPAQTLSPSSQQ